MITLERVHSLFSYERVNGILFSRETCTQAGWLDNSNGYWRVRVDGRVYYVHCLIWYLMTGKYPEKKEVDHADTDRANNRWSNLRRANPTLQQANRGVSSNNKLGVKGVSLCKSTGRYRADIRVNGRSINLGRYDTIEEASALYAEAARQYYGEFARAA
jgi:HNH endonuclease/AP2 domain